MIGDETDGYLAWLRSIGEGEDTLPDGPGLIQKAEGKPCCGDQPPGLLTKAASFGKAIVSHVAAGMPAADAATVEVRWATCRACPMFDAAGVVCRVCGCHLEIKIRWANERCPLGKW